jgi:excisionase family DNA binding protein
MTELLDINQVAAFLGVHRATVYREVRRKRLRMVKVGGSTRFRRTELERYLRDSERDRVA